jgi:hypothetical protein
MNEQVASAGATRSVFISHASKNLKVADSIRDILEARGVSCWIAPRDIQPGKQYGASIIDGISNSSVFLLLLTDESNLSPAVQNEVERAFGYQKTIIPVRISDVKPGKEIEFFVSNAQWVDAIYQPLKRRMDEVAAIVQAIEMSAKPPPVQPEKRTLLGAVEKLLERIFRHKTLSLVSGFVAVLGLSAFGIHVQTQGVEKVDRASVKIELSGEKINTAAESIQESSNKVAALDTAIGKLKKEVSDDPRKELIDRGYSVDSLGIRKAIAQGDLVAISHFNAIGYATQTPAVINEIFGESWDVKVANAIDPSVVSSICSHTPVEKLEYPIDGKVAGAEQMHLEKLKAMQRLCGTEKIRQLLTIRASGLLESNAYLAQDSLFGGEKDAIEQARLQINPNKYSKAPQHQKPTAVANREMGQCGQPNWPCTYAGDGISPEELKELERKQLARLNERQSSEATVQTQIKKYLAKLN